MLEASRLTKNILIAIFLTCLFTNSSFATSSNSSSPESELIGTWRWLGAVTPKAKFYPLKDEIYTVSFLSEGQFSMKIEKNVVNGGYQSTGKNITINQPLMMTMAAWSPDSPAPQFLSLFENATGFFFQEEKLYIDTLADGGTLHFERVE